MTIKGLEELKQNLSNISKNAIPRATSQSINRVAGRAISRSSTRVAKETRVKRKLIMQRSRLKRASPKKPIATIRVNRGNLPAIKLGPVRLQLSRRKRDNGSSGSVLKVGNFRFPGAFVQQLNNGRWHVLRRTGKSRYPVEVVKVPLVTPLTTAFKDELPKLIASDMPKELMAALKNQIRLVTK
ncbi:phage tail protein [Klebsiella michiganensis]|uniref:phage tail protein n=1 Tax=Klebsiella michiganensis TaxID=1134687 RepID=UPI000D0B071C|nr:phage tail protein [Klebsiella michiganensis]PSI97489.1 phage tail protein [Klebsiella michiganensis]HBM3165730.1 phage tail protein [Klebsiella michiganensis]